MPPLLLIFSPDFFMNESAVAFPSGQLQLEGLLAIHEGAARRAAVVCHPHPMYGGSMHNNVVEAILEALWQRGIATLRFNFRGVGGSDGEYDSGEGELGDARAAVKFLAERTGVNAITLAGYSFGASMALRAGLSDPLVDRVIAVALPVAVMNSGVIENNAKPVLLVSGDRDDYSPAASVRELAEKLGPHARFEVIAGADHFFGGDESELSARIVAALAEG